MDISEVGAPPERFPALFLSSASVYSSSVRQDVMHRPRVIPLLIKNWSPEKVLETPLLATSLVEPLVGWSHKDPSLSSVILNRLQPPVSQRITVSPVSHAVLCQHARAREVQCF